MLSGNILKSCIACVCLAIISPLVMADEAQQYLYKIRPVDRLLTVDSWADEDNAIVEEHFKRLVELEAAGVLILAGRTLNEGDSQFGIVIFAAESEASARQIMESDPAVVKGIMTAELFPYRVALIRVP